MGSALSVHGHNVKVTEVVKDGDVLTFLIVSEKVRQTVVCFQKQVLFEG